MWEASQYIADWSTEFKHIEIFERDFEKPAGGVSMPVLTAAEETQY